MKTGNKKKEKSDLLCKNSRVTAHTGKKRRFKCLKPICWIVFPVITATLLVLDALGVYTFNTERLIVLGIGLLAVLLPICSEIKIKDISIKCSDKNSSSDP